MDNEKHISFDTWDAFDNWLKGGLIKKTNVEQVDYVLNNNKTEIKKTLNDALIYGFCGTKTVWSSSESEIRIEKINAEDFYHEPNAVDYVFNDD